MKAEREREKSEADFIQMVIDRYALMNGCQILRDELRVTAHHFV